MLLVEKKHLLHEKKKEKEKMRNQKHSLLPTKNNKKKRVVKRLLPIESSYFKGDYTERKSHVTFILFSLFLMLHLLFLIICSLRFVLELYS